MKYYKSKPKIVFAPEREYLDTGNVFALTAPMIYYWGNERIVVPKGYASDGASVPQFLWSSVSPAVDYRTIAAAILHDYLYEYQPEGWSRWKADFVFATICHADGLNLYRTIKAWLGLRLFGWLAWMREKHNKDSINNKK